MAISEDLQLIAQCPDWTPSVSGISQGSILRPRHSDAGSGAKYMLRKSLDSNKLKMVPQKWYH